MAKKATARKPAAKKSAPRKGKKKLLTKADVMRKCKQLSNWGKWGPNDELGVLNYITPEDIANAAAFLASDQSSFMTGSDVLVDGGFTMV